MPAQQPSRSQSIRDHRSALVDLLLPRECVGCGETGVLLCLPCKQSIGPTRIHSPSPPPPGYPPTWVAGAYDGALRAAVLAMKERGRRDLTGLLARCLRRPIKHVIAQLPPDAGSVYLVPVPSSSAAAAARGGDHVRRIIAALPADEVPRTARLLIARRGTPDAGGMSAADRQETRSHAFALARGAARIAQDADLVLIDDIVTTGWTVAVCAGLLYEAGARSVAVAAIAATERHRKSAPEIAAKSQ